MDATSREDSKNSFSSHVLCQRKDYKVLLSFDDLFLLENAWADYQQEQNKSFVSLLYHRLFHQSLNR
jgi:hypothetical protein